jgi:hypothetical protein
VQREAVRRRSGVVKNSAPALSEFAKIAGLQRITTCWAALGIWVEGKPMKPQFFVYILANKPRGVCLSASQTILPAASGNIVFRDVLLGRAHAIEKSRDFRLEVFGAGRQPVGPAGDFANGGAGAADRFVH